MLHKAPDHFSKPIFYFSQASHPAPVTYPFYCSSTCSPLLTQHSFCCELLRPRNTHDFPSGGLNVSPSEQDFQTTFSEIATPFLPHRFVYPYRFIFLCITYWFLMLHVCFCGALSLCSMRVEGLFYPLYSQHSEQYLRPSFLRTPSWTIIFH